MRVFNTLDEVAAAVGEELGTSEWLTVDQDRVNKFADATGDHQWIHVDVERAKEGPFGGPIAHGYLTVSLIIPMFVELLAIEDVGMGVNYGLDKLRFPSPVKVGSRIRLHGRVGEVEDVPGGIQATLDFTVEVEGSEKPACIARAVYRYYA